MVHADELRKCGDTTHFGHVCLDTLRHVHGVPVDVAHCFIHRLPARTAVRKYHPLAFSCHAPCHTWHTVVLHITQHIEAKNNLLVPQHLLVPHRGTQLDAVKLSSNIKHQRTHGGMLTNEGFQKGYGGRGSRFRSGRACPIPRALCTFHHSVSQG